MPRLTLFAKGNSDVFEALFGCEDRTARWGGLNEALRALHPAWRMRLRHEILTRSDALLTADGAVPPELARVVVPPPNDLVSQCSPALFDTDADAIVLSIQADVTRTMVRHRASGHLFDPGPLPALSEDVARWLRATCEPMPLLTPEESAANWGAIVARLRRRTGAPILIFNMSTVVPGDTVDNHHGLGETLPSRIKRFNLALIDVSSRFGITVVDVDRLAARFGAARLKLDGVRLNCEGSRLVAEDVLRLLDDHGCFLDRP